MSGKVVVNRCMSLDGFIAGPGDAMDWIFDFMGLVQQEFPEIMAATGAMLVGRSVGPLGRRQRATATAHKRPHLPLTAFMPLYVMIDHSGRCAARRGYRHFPYPPIGERICIRAAGAEI